ncbi:MAG: hypothetical protein IIA88_11095, partial [Bacteroidetes bacterium]|nr:hypothetical protein [Bacteroidota bacterium]
MTMTNEEQPQERPIQTDDNDQHDSTQLLADIAEKQLLNITEYLDKSGQEINRQKRIRRAVI